MLVPSWARPNYPGQEVITAGRLPRLARRPAGRGEEAEPQAWPLKRGAGATVGCGPNRGIMRAGWQGDRGLGGRLFQLGSSMVAQRGRPEKEGGGPRWPLLQPAAHLWGLHTPPPPRLGRSEASGPALTLAPPPTNAGADPCGLA